MDDVVFIVCGGGAKAMFHDAEANFSIPAIIINSDSSSEIPMDGITPDVRLDQYTAYNIASSHSTDIKELLAGYRVAVIFGVLGGATATGMIPAIIECARTCGCRVVSVVGVPMVFEEDRRARALAALPSVSAISDRMFIMDVEAMNRLNDVKIRNALKVNSRIVAFMVDNLFRMLNGPFFSTFSQPVYTFAYVSDMDPAVATERAMETTVFETDAAEGKLIVLIGNGYGPADTDRIRDAVTSQSGILPEILPRDDAEDSKVLVFASVKLRIASSPTASRT